MRCANTEALNAYLNQQVEEEENYDNFRSHIDIHIKSIEEEIKIIKSYAVDFNINLEDNDIHDLINE